MANEIKINKRLKADFDLLREDKLEIVGVFLHGSQNYGLDDEHSDIDTKAIVLPSLKNLALGIGPVSYTRILPTDEHIDVKDIRVMFQCFKKQNVSMLEILFSDYCYINPEYEDIFKDIIDNREMIAHWNMHDAVRCILGMMNEKNHALEHPYPVNKDEIETYGYAAKQLHHIVRYKDFLEQYISGKSFKECLSPKDPKMLMQLKRTHDLSLHEARMLAINTIDEAARIKNDFIKETMNLNNQGEVVRLFNYVTLRCIERAVYKDALKQQAKNNIERINMCNRCKNKGRIVIAGECGIADNLGCSLAQKAYEDGYYAGVSDGRIDAKEYYKTE